MRLIAKRKLWYTRTIRAGEVFDAKDRDARTLKALQQAEDAPVGSLATAPVKPMDTGNSEAIVPVRRGRYGRRDVQGPLGGLDYARTDMRAEGG